MEQRAEVLSTFDDPETAFVNSGVRTKAGNGWLHFYKMSPKVKGYEIVFASSNNKAVENISKELPAQNAIDENFQHFNYFRCLSDKLLEIPTWGALPLSWEMHQTEANSVKLLLGMMIAV